MQRTVWFQRRRQFFVALAHQSASTALVNPTVFTGSDLCSERLDGEISCQLQGMVKERTDADHGHQHSGAALDCGNNGTQEGLGDRLGDLKTAEELGSPQGVIWKLLASSGVISQMILSSIAVVHSGRASYGQDDGKRQVTTEYAKEVQEKCMVGVQKKVETCGQQETLKSQITQQSYLRLAMAVVHRPPRVIRRLAPSWPKKQVPSGKLADAAVCAPETPIPGVWGLNRRQR
ncbi:hypothetical protein C8J57DRAFT_1239708 [Mycena rebaudengoi]|nr:hypothetical protein C8J57DRAFT_1239708 [Mycena rebaudengoi]